VEGEKVRSVAGLATRQDGVVARWQLLRLGVSAAAIKRRLGSGHLHRLHRGVYAVGHEAVSPRGRAIAALLAVGDGAVLSHRSAAWGHGLMPAPEIHDVMTSSRFRRELDGVHVHRVRSLPPSHVTSRDGLPLTTTARTLLDLAHRSDHATLQRAVNEADYRRQITADALHTVIAETRGHRGAANLRHAMRDQAPAKSHLEDRFYAMLRAAELPLPDVNALVDGIEVDFVWRDRRLIVETDGWAAHGTTLRTRRDARRDRRLAARGWNTLRVTRADLEHHPYAVLARLAGTLAEATRLSDPAG
jgi:very-short-patch-repair endonuclease